MKSKRKAQGGTTADALLGLLTLGPMSGYDIRSLIDRSIGHFWSESYGQIYPALKWLEGEGLVRKKTEQKEGRPDRNVLSLTPAGRKRLKEWLTLPPQQNEVPRSELLLKIFFGQHVPEDVSKAHIEDFRQIHQTVVERYEAIVERLHREEANDPQLPFWLMTLSFGMHRSKAFVAWADESLQTLNELERTKRKAAKSSKPRKAS